MGPVFITIQFQLGDELCRSVINGRGDSLKTTELDAKHIPAIALLSLKAPSSRQLVLLTTVASAWRGVWSTVGMASTRESRSSGKQPASVALCPPQARRCSMQQLNLPPRCDNSATNRPILMLCVNLNFTSTINQQMRLYNFHLKHFKTLKTTPTCFDLFRSSSGSFVVPC